MILFDCFFSESKELNDLPPTTVATYLDEDDQDADESLLRFTDSMLDVFTTAQTNYFGYIRECVAMRKLMAFRSRQNSFNVSTVQLMKTDAADAAFNIGDTMEFFEQEFDVVLPKIDVSLTKQMCEPTFNAQIVAKTFLERSTENVLRAK